MDGTLNLRCGAGMEAGMSAVIAAGTASPHIRARMERDRGMGGAALGPSHAGARALADARGTHWAASRVGRPGLTVSAVETRRGPRQAPNDKASSGRADRILWV